MKLEDINNYGLRAQGKNELIGYLRGKRLTRDQSIKAKCYECTNGYTDGVEECGIKSCPLYRYMPYTDVPAVGRTGSEEKET